MPLHVVVPGQSAGVHRGCLSTQCLLHQDAERPPADPTAYEKWGWPVTACGDQVLLTLDAEATALALPTGLVEAVTPILAALDRSAPVLVHPGAPQHRVLLAGEPFGVPLPWPAGVHTVTGALPLPPSTTPLGPITWHQPPSTPDLRTCREIDIFGAVRTTLRAAAHAQDRSI
ncbi:MAG: hypothetical protein ACRDT0_20095 [Pseudonocardiaceae bacterium]